MSPRARSRGRYEPYRGTGMKHGPVPSGLASTAFPCTVNPMCVTDMCRDKRPAR